MAKNKVFNADQFTATEFYSAEDKRRFAEHFVKFVLSGFKRTMFYKWFYQQLSNCFGHIAHYDINGFYAHFFENPEDMLRFVEITRDYMVCGNARYTFSDVERAIQSWFNRHDAEVKRVLRQQNTQHNAEVQAEEDRLAALKGQTHQTFKVVAKSENVGSFGHYGYIMLARDGSAWEVHRTCSMPWQQGQEIEVPLGNCNPNWGSVCCEAPIRKPNAPKEVVEQVFSQKVA